MNERTQIWNNGGGVQSAAIAALIVQRKLPKPDLAIIADTGYERSTTWRYLDEWIAPALATVGVPVHRVQSATYATKGLYGGTLRTSLLIPAYTTQNGEVGKMRTFCSNEWKRDVIRRWATRSQGVTAATNWLGFSNDEMGRAARIQSKQKKKWHVRFPLIELGLSRGECVALVEAMGWPTPPRSSCWMCPNHQVDEWREIKADGGDWPKVVRFEQAIRRGDRFVWLTPQAVPIEQADFDDRQEVLFGRDGGGCETGQCFV